MRIGRGFTAARQQVSRLAGLVWFPASCIKRSAGAKCSVPAPELRAGAQSDMQVDCDSPVQSCIFPVGRYRAPKPLRFCFYCAAGDGLFIKHSTALFFFQSANALLWFPHQRTGVQIDISAFLLSFSENFDADLTNANDCVMILKPIRRTEKIKSEHWERTCIYP